VTVADAAAIYGVVVDADTQKVDGAATDKLRANRSGGTR